jgi:hypothetical protein
MIDTSGRNSPVIVKLFLSSGTSEIPECPICNYRLQLTGETMNKTSQRLFMLIAGLHFVQTTSAMCVATTRNLIHLEVTSCQRVEIHASASKPPAHPAHKRGSSITGTLITGRVVESKLVWDGDARSAEYMVESKTMKAWESTTLFLRGNASSICPELVGTAATFVTNPLCCDVIPADGLCLVPGTIPIVQEEKRPERWTTWESQQ